MQCVFAKYCRCHQDCCRYPSLDFTWAVIGLSLASLFSSVSTAILSMRIIIMIIKSMSDKGDTLCIFERTNKGSRQTVLLLCEFQIRVLVTWISGWGDLNKEWDWRILLMRRPVICEDMALIWYGQHSIYPFMKFLRYGVDALILGSPLKYKKTFDFCWKLWRDWLNISLTSNLFFVWRARLWPMPGNTINLAIKFWMKWLNILIET